MVSIMIPVNLKEVTLTMTKYIYSEFDERRKSFFTDVNLNLFNIDKFGEVEIDTGCSYTNIAVKKFFSISESESQSLKEQDYELGLKYGFSFGASDSDEYRKKCKELKTKEDILSCKAVYFRHENVLLDFSGYKYKHSIRVNFDRDSNSLIGMVILKNFVSHIDISLVTGKLTYIGCRRNNITDDFLYAMKKHFGYVPIEVMRYAYEQGKISKEECLKNLASAFNDYIVI